MSYLIDSDWLIDVLAGIPAAIETLSDISASGVFISIITFGEIIEGAYRSPDPERHLDALQRFLSGFTILSLDESVMEHFARNRAHLRRQGLLIADMDLLIAATAIRFDLTLLTRNIRHFTRLPELRIYRHY